MFWRRSGGRFDIKDASLGAWVMRIAMLLIVLAVVILILRFVLPNDAAANVAPPDPLKAGWKGKQVCAVLHENDSLRVLRCAFAPGVGHEPHFHPAHFGFILEGGRMRITDANGTREQDTPSGASWWSDGISWHEAVNIGDTATSYLIVEPKGR